MACRIFAKQRWVFVRSSKAEWIKPLVRGRILWIFGSRDPLHDARWFGKPDRLRQCVVLYHSKFRSFWLYSLVLFALQTLEPIHSVALTLQTCDKKQVRLNFLWPWLTSQSPKNIWWTKWPWEFTRCFPKSPIGIDHVQFCTFASFIHFTGSQLGERIAVKCLISSSLKTKRIIYRDKFTLLIVKTRSIVGGTTNLQAVKWKTTRSHLSRD